MLQPVREEFNDFWLMVTVEVIRSRNDLVRCAGAAGFRQLCRVAREKRMLGTAGDD